MYALCLYPSQCVLLLGFDPEAGQGCTSEARAMCKLLDTADVRHWFLSLPERRRGNLHLILLVWDTTNA